MFRFVKGYDKMKADNDLAEIVDSIKHYRSKLRLLGIEDYQVLIKNLLLKFN